MMLMKNCIVRRTIPRVFHRGYKVLSIETSCDDTCIALMERSSDKVELIQHIKSTLDSTEFGGIVPTKAFNHHQTNLARITKELLENNNLTISNPPDVICVTRGPGMAGSLGVGIEFAKGLSVVYGKPFVGVHHMLGHLLVPRFESSGKLPQFPFLNLLVSGGHTMLVLSKDLLNHEILCNTVDIAAGDALDKCAREIGIKGNNLGKELEIFVNAKPEDWNYRNFDMPKPLYNKRGRMFMPAYSFAPFHGAVQRLVEKENLNLEDEVIKRCVGHHIQKAIFGHMIDKLTLVLENNKEKLKDVRDFVASGGVASNITLRNMLDKGLESTSIERTTYPNPSLCTDNAVMIGWAGIELYESGLTTELSIFPTPKWPLSDLLNVPYWIKKE
ncbi:hypothetical protein BN7_2166 [Wickerhamomyces ciferrii]|uniref:N(6)-L-threonylcarbamoyladenine synthase n=1 Tax=Wickerhamomyces ciferrii (strain ATCC 14091 / BCRC 22168 / CBS 111 / JCM 3599 / NBRC 0793 / NRRL Y-1031 F-60-10) TaxID=1206466 RepID=K0KKD3_WICCF|nr:uncharacterized protein BN7_2166 [Wickerhamomyces ciferrii]CCH42622.1 hypothetical protein BN7_2166 [Wickerhamomyces ciferrii]